MMVAGNVTHRIININSPTATPREKEKSAEMSAGKQTNESDMAREVLILSNASGRFV